MNKILLIISREYFTRVKKRTFIIMTLLGPMLFALVAIVPIWLASQDSSEHTIEVISENEELQTKFEDQSNIIYSMPQDGLEAAKMRVINGESSAVLYIPAFDLYSPKRLQLFSKESMGIDVEKKIENAVERVIENKKLLYSGMDREKIEALKTSINIQSLSLTETGDAEEKNTIAATGAGYFGGFLIYFFIFYYGTQVMRGVIEEKSNRIVEVIISSVRPFQLMMGKIIGIAAVGLTQFLLWILLTGGVVTGIMSFTGYNEFKEMDTATVEVNLSAAQQAQMEQMQSVMAGIDNLNIPVILIMFVIFFLGAYLLYSALFAAVGSASDSDADSQQFMLPVTIPLIISIVSLSAVIKDPNGPLAFWLSIIPFTSPVVMMMRVPFGVPVWEMALSVVLLVAGFFFTTWLAGRIYRVGILMHGTKVNYKTLGKWFLMKN